jgi:hypothetical protein
VGPLSVYGTAGTFTCSVCGKRNENTVYVPNLGNFLCPACFAVRVNDQTITFGGKDIGGSCIDCGDIIGTDDVMYCGSCGGHESCHDECSSGSYCTECDDDADYIRCARHATNDCEECGDSEAVVFCQSCARDIWDLTDIVDSVPLAILTENGDITVDGMEVNWN